MYTSNSGVGLNVGLQHLISSVVVLACRWNASVFFYKFWYNIFPFELYFIPCCSYSSIASFKNDGLPSVANLHCDRVALLNMAPGLALVRNITTISHTSWSYQNEQCLGCCLVCFSSFPKTPGFCMCLIMEKWFCLNGFAWEVFCLRLNWCWVLYISHIHCMFSVIIPWPALVRQKVG